MGVIDNIRTYFSRGRDKAAAKGDDMPTPRKGSAYPVVGGTPTKVGTVFRCVNLLADVVSTLPVQYMRQKGDIFVEDRGSRLHYLLNVQPSEYLSAPDFWCQVVRYLLLRGNAYVVPVYDPLTMEVARLALVDPTCVAHDTVNDRYTICDVKAAVSGTFDEDEVIHIKNYSLDGKTGISTLSYARTTTEIALAGDQETLNRFVNGGNVRGFVGNDNSVRGFGEYQDKQLEKTADDLDDRFRNGARIVSLPGQVQFSPISLSSTDMQFLESRKFTVQEICRFFAVPPSFVYADSSNNYKTVEMANVAFLSHTLNPMLRKIETELHRKLVAPSLCCKRKFLFDRTGLYACDLDSKVKYMAQTIATGVYTVNDWRRKENQPPVEGGDTVLVSANLKSITEAGKAAEPVKPDPVPAEPEDEQEHQEDGTE